MYIIYIWNVYAKAYAIWMGIKFRKKGTFAFTWNRMSSATKCHEQLTWCEHFFLYSFADMVARISYLYVRVMYAIRNQMNGSTEHCMCRKIFFTGAYVLSSPGFVLGCSPHT